MIYGYARTGSSTTKQKRNIAYVNNEALIVCGNDTKWKSLYAKLKTDDTLIVDSIKIFNKTPEELFILYKSLIDRGVNFVSCREPYLNSNVFSITDENKNYAFEVIQNQIALTYDTNIAIAAGIDSVKSRKQVGRENGTKWETKKSKKYKKIIEVESVTFGGDKTDKDLMEKTGLARATFYKYKREIRESQNTISHFRGDYFFLSNFYPHPIEWRGLKFACSEGAYQAAKTTPDRWSDFCEKDGYGAKRLGNSVSMREDWDDIKTDVMDEVLKIKFSDPSLKELLLATGDKTLIEDNNHGDRFWGVYHGKGENHLGLLLMKLRSELRGENGKEKE